MSEQRQGTPDFPIHTEWDELERPKPTHEEVAEHEREQATAELKYLGDEYRAIERDFIEKHPESKRKFASDPEKQANYDKFFIRKYEDKIADNRRRAAADAQLARLNGNSYLLARTEGISISYAHRQQTIEVQSGIMYMERLKALDAAIKESGGNDAHEQLLRQTWPIVSDHVRYEHMSPREVDETYDSRRTEAHNLMIDHLNVINDLAKQYSTRPFTCRNFQTSRGYNHNADSMGSLEQTLRTDRAMVQQYFDVVFGQAIKSLAHKIERESGNY